MIVLSIIVKSLMLLACASFIADIERGRGKPQPVVDGFIAVDRRIVDAAAK